MIIDDNGLTVRHCIYDLNLHILVNKSIYVRKKGFLVEWVQSELYTQKSRVLGMGFDISTQLIPIPKYSWNWVFFVKFFIKYNFYQTYTQNPTFFGYKALALLEILFWNIFL